MRLFVSYARVDKPLVTQIATLLTDGGHDVWFDHRLLPGQEWKQVLLQQISRCEVFVYALSPESVASEWCQWEFAKAIEFQKPILPILLQKNTQLPDVIRQYQYADFSDTLSPASIARLMGGLTAIAVAVPLDRKPDAPEDPIGLPAQGLQEVELTGESEQTGDNSVATSLRVVAGPGTGKTTSLMQQVAQLLKQDADSRRILLVTFTRTAAKDIEKALQGLDVPRANQIRKGTLHSFCFSVLQQASIFLQTGRIVRPLLEFEERFLLEDLGITSRLGDYYQRRRLLKAFEAAWAREQDQEPGWPINEVDREFQNSLYGWLRFHKAMLISEIVPETLKYLRNNPGCSELQQYDYVLVDEYQDLNRAEQNLVKLISANGMLTVVGDEDQSIYEAFRYARPESIYDSAESDFYDGDPLTTCYRCPTRIVDMANNLIRNNVNRMGRVLVAYPDNGEGEIHVVQWPDMEAEAQGIARFIDQRISTGQFDPGEILILCPRRHFGYMIRDALKDLDRPALSFFHEQHLEGNPKTTGDYQAQEAFTLLALAANTNDRVALRCWLGFGHQQLCRESYQELRQYCVKNDVSPMQALESLYSGDVSISRRMSRLVERYEALLQRLQELEGKRGEEILPMIFPSNQEWAKPFHTLVEDIGEDWEATDLLDAFRTSITQPELPTDVDYVRIMSLHKSKGLTADHVIVTGCIEGLIPAVPDNDLSFAEEERLREEQRRLFYVAITRPRKTLVLSSVLCLPRGLAHQMRARVTGGNREVADTIASTFISELGPQCPGPVFGPGWRY